MIQDALDMLRIGAGTALAALVVICLTVQLMVYFAGFALIVPDGLALAVLLLAGACLNPWAAFALGAVSYFGASELLKLPLHEALCFTLPLPVLAVFRHETARVLAFFFYPARDRDA